MTATLTRRKLLPAAGLLLASAFVPAAAPEQEPVDPRELETEVDERSPVGMNLRPVGPRDREWVFADALALASAWQYVDEHGYRRRPGHGRGVQAGEELEEEERVPVGAQGWPLPAEGRAIACALFFDMRELRYPPWMAHRERLARSLHVFKLNAAVGLGSWALRQRPGTRVLHIVRHPGGFARSWLKRWVQGEGGRERSSQSSDRLRELARRAPAWAVLLGDVDALERAEGELWWWRYVNETLHEAGRGHAGYRLVFYDELAARPLDVTRQVHGSCGLPWDDTIAARVGSIASGADTIARAWKDELEPSLVQLVERVLDGSSMATWWRAAEAA